MFLNLRNSIDFFLRRKIHFSRINYTEKNENKADLGFSDFEVKQENYLLNKYNFEDYKNNSTVANYCQNLYILALLDKYLLVNPTEKISILDIGSKNWYYVRSEYSYFRKYCTELQLDGVEIDAYRLYANFYNRLEVAKFYMKGLSGVNYISDDVRNINNTYDYIIWILPFVLIEPHRYWGLPDKYFNPHNLFKHAHSLLNSKGKMFIINQGEHELEAQKNIIKGLNFETLLIDNIFYQYKYNRYLSIIEKE